MPMSWLAPSPKMVRGLFCGRIWVMTTQAHISAINLGEVFNKSVDLFKKYFKEVVGATVIYTILTYLLDVGIRVEENPGLYWFLSIIILLAETVISFVILVYIHTSEGGKKISYTSAFQKTLPRIVPVLIAILLTFLLIAFGFILLIIPGVIALVLFSNSFYFALLENKGSLESLFLAKRLTKGNRFRIFLGNVGVTIPFLALITFFTLRVGEDAAGVAGIIPSAFSTVFYYSLWRALRSANPLE